ncbi:MAG: DUF4131 domain-containing protein [Gammaproteobacteria bacterium]|nr:DUF4131 domain-containing protein [Gammaproteobacteria bacterium]
MLLYALAFATGCALIAQHTALPDPFYGQFLPLIALLLWRVRGHAMVLPRVCLAGAGGVLWAATSAHVMLSCDIVASPSVPVTVEGIVASVPRQRRYGVQFELALRAVNGEHRPLANRVRLNWYDQRSAVLAGAPLGLRVRLRLAPAKFNPGGFDYAGWLFRNGIDYTGYVRDSGPVNTPFEATTLTAGVEQLRMVLRGRIQALLNGHSAQGVIEALALGLRDAITEEQWTILRRTGTAHLMAVSGLHIGLIAGAVFACVSWSWRRLPRLAFIAAPRAAAIGALGAALVYAALAGFSLPTQRALIMAFVFFASVYLLRPLRGGAALGTAVIIILLFSPASVMAPGLWLSCAAVAVLLYGMRGHTRGPWPVLVLRTQWVVAVGLTPVALTVFGESTGIGIVANALAVPLVGGLAVPTVLLAMLEPVQDLTILDI